MIGFKQALSRARTLFRLNPEEEADCTLRNNLHILIFSMAFSSIFLNITTASPLTGFLQFIQSGDFIFGLMVSLPYFGAVFQLLGAKTIFRFPKKSKLYYRAAMIQRSLWIIIGFIPIFGKNNLTGSVTGSIVLLAALSSVAGAFSNVTLTTLMGQIIPQRSMGTYLSSRNRIGTAANLITGLLVSVILDTVCPPYNYTVVFLLAGVCGMIDAIWMARLKEPDTPPENDRTETRKTIRQMFGVTLSKRKFRNYTFFWIAWNFSYMIASPFNSRYILGPLGISFTQYTVFCNFVYFSVSILTLPGWGRFIDRFGCKAAIYLSFGATSLMGFLWLFSVPKSLLIPFVFHLLGGFFWGVIDLVNQHMMISQTPTENRQDYVAVFSMLTLVFGYASGVLLSGLAMELLSGMGGTFTFFGVAIDKYQVLFIAASILRLITLAAFVPIIAEQAHTSAKTAFLEMITKNRRRGS